MKVLDKAMMALLVSGMLTVGVVDVTKAMTCELLDSSPQLCAGDCTSSSSTPSYTTTHSYTVPEAGTETITVPSSSDSEEGACVNPPGCLCQY
jgi:hypothetical protein